MMHVMVTQGFYDLFCRGGLAGCPDPVLLLVLASRGSRWRRIFFLPRARQ